MHNHHALIIDDNQLNIEVLIMMLSEEGTVSTALTVWRHLKQALDHMDRIDVVFLDLEFPHGDGFDLLKILKADPRLNGVPIVAYSVHTSEIERARRAGFHSFLGKPINAQQFSGQLQRILNHEAVWEA